jgi:hypothetical protein
VSTPSRGRHIRLLATLGDDAAPAIAPHAWMLARRGVAIEWEMMSLGWQAERRTDDWRGRVLARSRGKQLAAGLADVAARCAPLR